MLESSNTPIGTQQYNNHDVYLAAQYGVLLEDTDQGRGKKSAQYPNGRFPHAFTQNKNGVSLGFLPGCPDNDDIRAEYPLVTSGPYNGGLNNNKWGQDRVVYTHEQGEVDEDGHPKATFCGVMTHTGASETGAFVLCTSS